LNSEFGNIGINNLKKFCKKFVRKVDAAISFSPEVTEEVDKDFKLYIFLCEAKKPDLEHCDNDYGKLVRLMHGCYNSWIIYYSKKAKIITKKLVYLFQNLIIYGLHIHGIYNL
jgi:hypothetical protein